MNERQTAFGHFHPVPAFVYITSLTLVTMFTSHPVILALSLAGAALFSVSLHTLREFLSDISFYPPLFIMISLTNPLFSHNGATPLFFMNGNPVTLEALWYGVDIAAMTVAVLLWCRCFSDIMTSDRVMYLIGRAAPKAALVVSMSLRFIPLFKRKWHEIKRAQISMGYYSEAGFVSKLQSSARVFSALVTWALENAVDTGASMRARGGGLHGRTHISLFRFTSSDGVLLAAAVLLGGISFAGLGTGAFRFGFYPRISTPDLSARSVCLYLAFALFCLIPFIIEITEALKWKYLRSKI